MNFNIQNIAKILNISVLNYKETQITNFCMDSRKLEKNNLFILRFYFLAKLADLTT